MTTIPPLTVCTGRIRTFIEEPQKQTMAPSCTLYVYDNDLEDCLLFVDRALRGGAGVKVQLEKFIARQSLDFDWGFYLHHEHPDYHLVNQNLCYFSNRLFDPAWITVTDSMEEGNDFGDLSIRDSWSKFIDLASSGRDIVVDLSALRPAGTKNEAGLVATGPLGYGDGDGSFLSVYSLLANHLRQGDIISLMQLLGQLNRVLRRGGTYKNGITTNALHYNHPDIKTYLKAPLHDLPGGQKKGVRIDNDVLKDEELCNDIVEELNKGGLFLEKIVDPDLFSNVCVTSDTWVQTSDGARMVNHLVNKPFIAIVNGKEYASTENGFWSNGNKSVLKLSTKEGYEICLTHNHRVLRAYRNTYQSKYKHEWVEVSELKIGDKVQLNNHRVIPRWEGKGTFEQGWVIGSLIGDGTYHPNGSACLQFFGNTKEEMLSLAVERLSQATEHVKYFASNHWSAGYSRKGYTSPVINRIQSRSLAILAEEYGVKHHQKVPDEIIESTTSSEFYRGFLQGFFDADGCVCLKNYPATQVKFVRLDQSNLTTVKLIQRMLLRLGIFSRIYCDKRTSQTFPGGKVSQVKPSYQLYVRGDNIPQYAALVGFSDKEKKETLSQILSSYYGRQHTEQFLATVKSIEDQGEREVFDCTIQDAHCFDANGFVVHNCEEVLVKHKGVCLLSHGNAAICNSPEQLIDALVSTTLFVTDLHLTWRKRAGDKAQIYLPLEQDRQIGVGWCGWANFLRRMGVTYRQHIEALEANLAGRPYHDSVVASTIAECLVTAYYKATKMCDQRMICAGYETLERIFLMAPCQRNWVDYQDPDGFALCRSIDPPFNRFEFRDSHTDSSSTGRYDHGLVETMLDVGHDLHQRHWEAWQRMMNLTGRSHTMSFDLWKKVDIDWFRDFVLRSPLQTTYYQFADKLDQQYLNKGMVWEAVDACDLAESERCGSASRSTFQDDEGCVSCAE